MKYKKILNHIYGIAVVVTIAVLGLILVLNWKTDEPVMEIFPDGIYNETISVVADSEYPPFSFEDEQGNMIGYDLEVLNAIANEMKVNLDMHYVPWNDALEAMEDGTVDVILGLEYQEKYKDLYLLTDPLEINQTVAFGKNNYKSIYELYDKKIAILTYSMIDKTLIGPLALENVLVYDTYEEAFADIQSGELDYLIGRYSVGNRVLAQQGITNVRAVGKVLSNNAFCFGVQKGDRELLDRMNVAIETLIEDGTVAEISDKWLGDFVGIIDLRSYFIANKYEITLIAIVAIVGYALIITSSIKYKRIAEIDSLTGLSTIYKFTNEVNKILDGAKSKEYMIVAFDIKQFKHINNMYGTYIGDMVICALANMLRDLLQTNELLCRHQNDNFIIFSKNKIPAHAWPLDEDKVLKPIQVLLDKKAKELDIDIPIYINAGCYEIENPNDTVAYMIDCANIAKEKRKHIIGSTFTLYTKSN